MSIPVGQYNSCRPVIKLFIKTFVQEALLYAIATAATCTPATSYGSTGIPTKNSVLRTIKNPDPEDIFLLLKETVQVRGRLNLFPPPHLFRICIPHCLSDRCRKKMVFPPHFCPDNEKSCSLSIWLNIFKVPLILRSMLLLSENAYHKQLCSAVPLF